MSSAYLQRRSQKMSSVDKCRERDLLENLEYDGEMRLLEKREKCWMLRTGGAAEDRDGWKRRLDEARARFRL